MELWNGDVSELEVGSSVESFQRFLASQRELLHSQIDQFQEIIVTQCKLTGVNPLSQEMAAGALSIKIGKRPRDLLNPKAVNYMQSVFSIKDAISKKESREISALFGVTVSQVRDFFTSQRSRVRKLVQLSREKALKSNSCAESLDVQMNSDPVRSINPAPLNSDGAINVEEASCSTQEAALSDLDDLDKQFVENIFGLMQKEETFCGQEKLMEWILSIQNFSVLLWFLTGGGAITLANWLTKAAVEEQTSVLLLILKVLCHLPLHKALPAHISALLQSVNRLRFYRTSDISNRARVLLSKWSKLLTRNQAIKKPNGVKPSYDGQKETLLSQSIGQIIGPESWHFNVPEDILALSNEFSDNFRKMGSQSVKLSLPSSDDCNKKPPLGVSSSQSRERRKVQLVEQPGSMSRSPHVARSGSVSQGRPMSADDIQKAKMRALFMQSKHGKTALKENKEAKIRSLSKSPKASIAVCSSKVPAPLKIEEEKKPLLFSSKTTNRLEASYSKLTTDLKETLAEKCKRVKIFWKTPAEVKLNDRWRVGAGQNSKEVHIQENRNRRDKEAIYQTAREMPSNPKEPWDFEMDYDDSLTLEIPIEQLPDSDDPEIVDASNEVENATHPAVQGVSSSSASNAATAEPDLELLAVLLKNPDLVFALTSGQIGNISNEETLKLLDMIKRGSVNTGLSENANRNYGTSSMAPEKVEVSLPSPTPSSNPSTSGCSIEAPKNPFTRQNLAPDRRSFQSSSSIATANLSSQISATSTTVRQQHTFVPFSKQLPGTAVSTYSLPQANNNIHEKQPLHSLSSVYAQTPFSDRGLAMNNSITADVSPVGTHTHAMRVDGISNIKPVAPNSTMQEGLPNSFPQSFTLNSPTTSRTAAQQQRNTHMMPHQPHFSEPSYHDTVRPYQPQFEKSVPASDYRRVRQDMPPSYHSQRNHDNYNTLVGGSMPSGSWDRNNHERGGFETWSPENSPTRNPRYVQGRNLPDSRTNHVRNNRPEWSRQRGSSGHWNPGRHENRKWNDQRR
ncbi:homeobox protein LUMINIDEPENDENS [Lathyrus oleraceus]|uniref:Homeobox domain-containing protein n=2 Tax=Pisum sativum TaxID=3888 RepID=A0A9D4XU96_PEA|nr:homeobox protein LUMINIDEPENDENS [Pisum sativum]KAI5425070.1 hypothetical protein KIW84_031029 [Pisum sativum]